MSRSTLIKIAPWGLLILLGLIWQLIVTGFNVSSYLFPSVTDVWRSLVTDWRPIAEHSLQTLYTTLVGFVLAVVFGLFLGIAVGASNLVYKAVYPLLVGFNSIPKVAFVPVLVVWFGIGTVPAIATAFLISFFPIVVNVATGLATVEPEMEDVLRSLGASRMDILKKVGLPRSLPYFFASLKVAITLAFVGSVISETVASNLGIGYLMMAASSTMNMALVFAGLIVIGAMGVVMYEIFAFVEKRMTHWAHR
ncbi:ABC transporter permease [Affinibrenneria salicis]|uniref:ABC transporter permease n=1 Tax=Affinibrenneria salicis TaxID=2590031 RepID=A0A5J5G6F6_9GAMM|nr:ABC transporter permease [Affinibrenneria salicis]KAA9002816.1 ABC transporter permease [Affinibrenneria salicis]KAA9002897.1 ABC transporter permease [Affinibrenneria salicis]